MPKVLTESVNLLMQTRHSLQKCWGGHRCATNKQQENRECQYTISNKSARQANLMVARLLQIQTPRANKKQYQRHDKPDPMQQCEDTR